MDAAHLLRKAIAAELAKRERMVANVRHAYQTRGGQFTAAERKRLRFGFGFVRSRIAFLERELDPPDVYLRGYTATGSKVHAVKITGDPRPLAHTHSPRNALCGARVAVSHAYFRPTAHAYPCATCARRHKGAAA